MKMTVSFPGCCLLIFISFIAKNSMAISPLEQTMIRTKMIALAIECVQSNPLTFDEIKSFKNNVVPDKENAKCFTACLYKKMGIMDDMGMLSPARARKQAEKVFKDEEKLNNVTKIMEDCLYVNELHEEDSKGCDRAKEAFSCLIKTGPKYDFAFS